MKAKTTVIPSLAVALLAMVTLAIPTAEASRTLPNVLAPSSATAAIPVTAGPPEPVFVFFTEDDIPTFTSSTIHSIGHPTEDDGEISLSRCSYDLLLAKNQGGSFGLDLLKPRPLASRAVYCVGALRLYDERFRWYDAAACCFLQPSRTELVDGVDLFQGLWTDPTTGLSYARNRWYDARTASWLSEDPMGAVDSPNLYAFVGWGPHMRIDPMGLEFSEADVQRVLWIYDLNETSKDYLCSNYADTGDFAIDYGCGTWSQAHPSDLVRRLQIINAKWDAAAAQAEARKYSPLREASLQTAHDVQSGADRVWDDTAGRGFDVAHDLTAGELRASKADESAYSDSGLESMGFQDGRVLVVRGVNEALETGASGADFTLNLGEEWSKSWVYWTAAGGAVAVVARANQLRPFIQTGVGGRIEVAYARIRKSHLRTGTRTTDAARRYAARMGGNSGDDAGHLIARILGGKGGRYSWNIVPQNPSVNRGAFARFEERIASWVSAGDDVFIRITPVYVGQSTRPTEFVYEVFRNGQHIVRNFPN